MPSATIGGPTVQAVTASTNIFGGLVRSVTWSIDDRANLCEIEIPKKRFHEFRDHSAGKPVWVRVMADGSSNYIFHGWLTGRYGEFSPDSESVSVVCNGPRWHMHGDILKGKYLHKSTSLYDIVSGHKCIFNEKVENSTIEPGNGMTSKLTNGVRPFSLDPRDSELNTQYDVNDMLWYVYYIGRRWHTPAVVENCLTLNEFGLGTLGELKPYDVNVDGQTITQAIQTIMTKAGLRWWCRPIGSDQSELVAYTAGPNADAPRKYLYLADVADGSVTPPTAPVLRNIGTSNNNVEAGRIHEDYANTVDTVYGFGDRKKYQHQFELVPGWTTEAQNDLVSGAANVAAIRRQLSKQTATNWDNTKDIGRLWILDEDGSVSGTAYDFSPIFEHDEWAHVRRVFLGDRVDGVQINGLEVQKADSTWEQYRCNVRIEQTQAGIRIEGGEIASPILIENSTANQSTFASKVRITLVVKEDNALERTTTNTDTSETWQVGIIGAGTDTIERRQCMVLDSEYETDNINSEKETQVIADFEELLLAKLEEASPPRVSASFSIPWITTVYEPGDIICGIKGRNLYFTAQVVEVRFSFTDAQRTEITLEDLRLAES